MSENIRFTLQFFSFEEMKNEINDLHANEPFYLMPIFQRNILKLTPTFLETTFTKIPVTQLADFFDIILSKHQWRFRKRFSTQHIWVNMSETCHMSPKKKQIYWNP